LIKKIRKEHKTTVEKGFGEKLSPPGKREMRELKIPKSMSTIMDMLFYFLLNMAMV
jgi:hypothetical protein